MKTLLAIGGGSFQSGDTKAMDEYVIKQTGKQHPHVLFLPTASRDDQGYAKRFKKYYRALGCEVESLRLFHTLLSRDEIKDKILSADVLYLGAGSLRLLMCKLKEENLVNIIKEAYEQGVICVGNSAGASAYFTYGYSDLYDDGSKYEVIEGMNIIQGIFCPHIQDEKRKGFYTIAKSALPQIACEDDNAYLVEDSKTYYFYR